MTNYTMGILLDKLLAKPELPAYLKQLIKKTQSHTHVTIGEWLKETSTPDLLSAHYSARKILTTLKPAEKGDDPNEVGHCFVYLVDVLTLAEGMEITRDTKITTKRYDNLSLLVSAELLKRRKFELSIDYGKATIDEGVDALKFIQSGDDAEVMIELGKMTSKVSEKETPKLAAPNRSSEIDQLSEFRKRFKL